MKFFVTGASGFIGSHLCARLKAQGHEVRSVSRAQLEINETDWSGALEGAGAVIHLAARVHIMRESTVDPLAEFRKVNVEGTKHLARCAAMMGVKRFVFISSIGVHGSSTTQHPFTESSPICPHNSYTQSKWEAELSLKQVAKETGLELVIVRPPLVYGAAVPGNFIQMMDVVSRRIPLPFAAVRNQRSLIFVGNLVDALISCALHPVAAGKTYLVCDGEDISTPELLNSLGAGMGRPARLFQCPMWLLSMIGGIAGRSDQLQRLVGSLQIDSYKIRSELNWKPPYSLQQGLKTTAEWYRDTHR